MLFNKAKNKFNKVVVDELEMKFKCLTLNEVKELEEFSKCSEEDISKLFFYISDNFIVDANGAKVCKQEDVAELPIEFISKVITKFFKTIHGNLTEEEIKKN